MITHLIYQKKDNIGIVSKIVKYNHLIINMINVLCLKI